VYKKYEMAYKIKIGKGDDQMSSFRGAEKGKKPQEK
jgi:hypothetical protein